MRPGATRFKLSRARIVTPLRAGSRRWPRLIDPFQDFRVEADVLYARRAFDGRGAEGFGLMLQQDVWRRMV
jgi:hypothetical protein